MSKHIHFSTPLILLFLLQGCASNPIKDYHFAPLNREWCQKSQIALSKAGFDKLFIKNISEQEFSELKERYSLFSQSNRDNLQKIFFSHDLFCTMPYYESKQLIPDLLLGKNKDYDFYFLMPASATQLEREVNSVFDTSLSDLNLKDEDFALYYYTINKQFGDDGFTIYRIPQIVQLQKLVNDYSSNGSPFDFYDNIKTDVSFVKTVELVYPSMSGIDIETSKIKRKAMLDSFKLNLIKKIKEDFVYNGQLREFARNHLPVPISSKEGDEIIAKLKEIKSILFPVPVEDFHYNMTDYTIEKYFNSSNSYVEKEMSYIDLTNKNPRERYSLFGEYLLANTVFDFNRVSENKVEIIITIDIPIVLKSYGKNPLSKFLVK